MVNKLNLVTIFRIISNVEFTVSVLGRMKVLNFESELFNFLLLLIGLCAVFSHKCHPVTTLKYALTDSAK